MRNSALMLAAVLRIHDILGWIRIRRSMPLTCGSGSCYFRHWPSRCQQKTNFQHNFFCLLPVLFEGTCTSFFQDKSQKESQNRRNQGFLTIFAWWSKDPDPNLWLVDPDPGGPKTCGSGSAAVVGSLTWEEGREQGGVLKWSMSRGKMSSWIPGITDIIYKNSFLVSLYSTRHFSITGIQEKD